MAVLFATTAYAGDGAAIFKKKCMICHSLAGEAGPKADLGGPLDGVGSKRDEEWLRAYLVDPKSKIPDAKMPKMKMSQGDWDAVVAFLLEQTAPASPQ